MRRRRRIVFVVAAMVVAPLGACTPGPSDERASESQQAAEPFPLDEFLSGVWGLTAKEQNEIRLRVETQRGEFVAQCMADAGFDYVPWAGSGFLAFPSPPDDRDWVASWGYGIADSPEGGKIFAALAEPGPDPNAEIVAALTPTELSAYRRALLGSLAGGESGGDLGCREASARQVLDGIWHLDEFAPLRTALEELRASVEDDSDVRAANDEWSQCMSDAGFPGLESPTHAFVEIQRSIPAGMDRKPGSAAIRAFQEKEISQALADYDCRRAVRMRERVTSARVALETQFIEAHREALESAQHAARRLDVIG